MKEVMYEQLKESIIVPRGLHVLADYKGSTTGYTAGCKLRKGTYIISVSDEEKAKAAGIEKKVPKVTKTEKKGGE